MRLGHALAGKIIPVSLASKLGLIMMDTISKYMYSHRDQIRLFK